MNASRHGMYAGTACTLPIVIWMLIQNPSHLNELEWQATALLATQALYITLAITIALFVPWHARHGQWRENSMGAILLVLVALPFTTLTWLSAVATAGILSRGLAGLIAFALTVLCSAKLVELLRYSAETKAVMRVTLQLTLATLTWTFSDSWLYWIGL